MVVGGWRGGAFDVFHSPDLRYICPPGVLGIWGEWPFIFRELGSTDNYFRGSREQAHIFGDLGSPAKKIKEKPPFCFIF